MERMMSNENDDTNGYSIYRDRILHTLSIYPKISPSMLQIGIGTSVTATLWKPVLEDLIEEGLIIRSHMVAETPTGRMQSYVILERVQTKSAGAAAEGIAEAETTTRQSSKGDGSTPHIGLMPLEQVA
jgi:hypothetical protein